MSELKVKMYATYSYSHDPLMTELVGRIEQKGFDFKSVAETSQGAASTLRDWKNKKTRHPRISTLRANGRAVGLDLFWGTAADAALFAKRTKKHMADRLRNQKEREAKKAAKEAAKAKRMALSNSRA